MSFYSLPRVKLHKKDEIKKLDTFSSDYSRLLYKQNAKDVDIDLPSVVAEQIVKGGQALTDNIIFFLLDTSNYGQEIQSDIDLYVTRGKHNKASFRKKLDPIEKNVWRTENPLALLLGYVSNFDAQNPVIGSLLREIDLEKKRQQVTFSH